MSDEEDAMQEAAEMGLSPRMRGFGHAPYLGEISRLNAEIERLRASMSDQYETIHAEFERLRADNARLESAFSDCAENAEAWHQKAERLRARNATLIETLKGARCPVDSRSFVGECQQCGCAAGILIRDEQSPHKIGEYTADYTPPTAEEMNQKTGADELLRNSRVVERTAEKKP